MLLALFIICFSLGYALLLSSAKRVVLGKDFYYVVEKEENVEVGAEFSKLEGGAGYFLEENGRQYVAHAVYFKEIEGKSVVKNLQANGQDVSLMKREVGTLYFKGKEKEFADTYVSALCLLDNYMQIFQEYIIRLEKGLTQERAKELLLTLERQFLQAKKTYKSCYAPFAETCGENARAIEEICRQTIYVKDLRYLLCLQSERYKNLCDSFCL